MRLVGEKRDLRVEQREVDVLTFAGFGAMAISGAAPRCVAYMPVIMSTIGTPTRCGPPPGRSSRSPVTLMSPPMPWIMKS